MVLCLPRATLAPASLITLEIMEGRPREVLVSTVEDEMANPIDSESAGISEQRLYECDQVEMEGTYGSDRPEENTIDGAVEKIAKGGSRRQLIGVEFIQGMDANADRECKNY